MIAKTNTQHYSDIADAVRYSLDGTQYESSLAQARAEIAEDNELFEDISEAIQSKTGQLEPYDKDELASTITSELVVPNLTHLEVTPTTSQQTITPEAPVIGFSEVIATPVTASIDPAIQPDNIKQGVDILGVQGTLKPPTLTTKQITENGIYSAEDDNADGYSEVEVDVSDPIVNKLLDGTLEELINHNVTSLRSCAFYLQTSLQKVYCRELTTLGYGAFQGATYLRVGFFPKLVSIEYNIFYGSGYNLPLGMQALILKSKTTLKDRSSFTQNTTNFYVPTALLSWYSTATNWSVYYGDGRILTIEDNLEFLESFGFTEEELLSE